MVHTLGSGLVADWDLISAINNSKNYAATFGGAFVGLIGIAVIIWAVFQLGLKIIGSEKGRQTSWFMVIAGIVVGGALVYGGWQLIMSVAQGGHQTINDLGGGTILPLLLG